MKSPLNKRHPFDRRSSLRRALIIGLLMLGQSLIGFSTAADDQVTLRKGSDSEVRTRSGKIVDFNGKYLELQTTSGQSSRIPTREVIAIRTEWSTSHQAALQAVIEHDYDKAYESAKVALSEETRTWVQRDIVALQIKLAKFRGSNLEACRLFRQLCRQQPDHRHWNCVPIPWRPESPDVLLEREAQTWIEEGDSFAKLLGASWLLSGSNRTAAESALRELSRSGEPMVSQLATAQLWRIQRETNADRVDQWQASLADFPEDARTGPRYLIAKGLQAIKEFDAASLVFWQVVILDPSQYELNAMALLEAGRCAEASEHPQEARKAFRELTQRFPDSVWAQQQANR